MTRRAGLLALLICGSALAGAPHDPLKATPEAMQWWREARFGMFVCWGPVSLTGKEIGWSRGAPAWGRRKGVRGGRGPTPAAVYDSLYETWKPDKFDAREWVRVAQAAGMKYMIFLVKHHDGFCLYDTALTDYCTMGTKSAWRVDVMKQIADACHEAGLKLIVYYSQPDWHHPDYLGERHDRYIAFLHGQVRELLTDYGRIDGLWFDNLRPVSPATAKLWETEGLFRMARGLQPHLIINNRCGLPGDYDTPEQKVGHFNDQRPWESCITLGTQWAWLPNDRIKSLEECTKLLARCAGGDGNLALNTNPMPEGCIEPRQVERLKEIGAWLKQYGHTIYGTRGGPWRPTRNVVSTCKGNKVYIHIVDEVARHTALLPIERKLVSSRSLLGQCSAVSLSDGRIEIRKPPSKRDFYHPHRIIELTLDGPAFGLKPGRITSGSLATGKPARASNTFQKNATYSPDKAFDDDPETRWGCDWGTKAAWLEVDLGKPTTIGRAVISEPYGRVQEFALEYRDGDAWRAFARGKTIGERRVLTFQPVTARIVRLNLLRCTEGPSIWELQLFPPAK